MLQYKANATSNIIPPSSPIESIKRVNLQGSFLFYYQQVFKFLKSPRVYIKNYNYDIRHSPQKTWLFIAYRRQSRNLSPSAFVVLQPRLFLISLEIWAFTSHRFCNFGCYGRLGGKARKRWDITDIWLQGNLILTQFLNLILYPEGLQKIFLNGVWSLSWSGLWKTQNDIRNDFRLSCFRAFFKIGSFVPNVHIIFKEKTNGSVSPWWSQKSWLIRNTQIHIFPLYDRNEYL